MVEIRFTSADIGCHLEGAHGWHNDYRVVDMAEAVGMELTEQDRADVAAYKSDEGYRNDLNDPAGAIIDRGGLVDRAMEFLNSVTEKGLSWEWDMGELSLSYVQHEWEYGGPGSKIRQCRVCRERETYWDDEAYPVDPCPGAADQN